MSFHNAANIILTNTEKSRATVFGRFKTLSQCPLLPNSGPYAYVKADISQCLKWGEFRTLGIRQQRDLSGLCIVAV